MAPRVMDKVSMTMSDAIEYRQCKRRKGAHDSHAYRFSGNWVQCPGISAADLAYLEAVASGIETPEEEAPQGPQEAPVMGLVLGMPSAPEEALEEGLTAKDRAALDRLTGAFVDGGISAFGSVEEFRRALVLYNA